jgi:ferrochelatase
VVEAPRWLWWLALNGVILPLRSRRSAAAYRSVWTEHGSPLLDLSQRLTDAVAAGLVGSGGGIDQVRLAMRYGEPSIRHVLRAIHRDGLRRLLVVPLYPQYSATTTASVFDAVAAELASWRVVPEWRCVADYASHPLYIEALAESVRAHRSTHGDADILLFSFHGIPQRYVRHGDPYAAQCEATARAVAQRLDLPSERWALTYQSRVGREPWLMPYTDQTLAAWPSQGKRSVQVLCPGFAVDCLETLEEIAQENRERFLHAGGERFEYIACLNDSAAHVRLLSAVIAEHTRDWRGEP